MADKSIGDLNFAPGTVDDSNTLFVVQQAGAAYKLSGHNFILALTTILDGHGGVASIEKTGTSGLVDTYTITYADQTTTTFTVNNGNGVTGITQYWAVSSSNTTVPSSWSTTRQTMTATNRYLWSYLSFTLDSGTIDTPKSVVGVYGDQGDSWYVWIRYAGQRPTSDADIGTTPDDWIGIYSGTASTAPTSYTAYSWFQYKGEKGDQGDPAVITQQSVTYQEGTSGTVAPSGTWVANVPTVTPGNFLWTRMVLEFNDGTSVTSYSVSRYGIDGTGSVSTVNNVSPDANGNIALTATDIPTSDNASVQTHISAAEIDIDNLQSDMTDAQGDIRDINTALSGKQATLVSGTNIKTVNGQSLLGSGNLAAIPTGGAAGKALVKASSTNYDVTWGDAGGALWFTGVTVSATTGDIVTITDSAITADHVLGRIEWANPSAITTDVTWTTSAGSLVLNGTAASATTANILLVLKNN